jgi:flagellar basal-body rod protein FlgC
MEISGSALTAQRYRMDIIGENIANADNTRTADGSTYRRKNVIFQERPMTFADRMGIAVSNSAVGVARTHHYHENYRNYRSHGSTLANRQLMTHSGGGVRVVSQVESQQPFKLIYDPQHPDANEEGYVQYPNVDIEREMVDFISATRSYEANITAINNFKNIAMKALEIGR